VDDKWGKTWTGGEMRRTLRDHGIEGRGTGGIYALRDQAQSGRFSPPLKGALGYVPLLGSDRNRLVRAGFTVGEAIEDNARIANFLDGIQNGPLSRRGRPARQEVPVQLRCLSDFERKVLRRWVPFYT